MILEFTTKQKELAVVRFDQRCEGEVYLGDGPVASDAACLTCRVNGRIVVFYDGSRVEDESTVRVNHSEVTYRSSERPKWGFRGVTHLRVPDLQTIFELIAIVGNEWPYS